MICSRTHDGYKRRECLRFYLQHHNTYTRFIWFKIIIFTLNRRCIKQFCLTKAIKKSSLELKSQIRATCIINKLLIIMCSWKELVAFLFDILFVPYTRPSIGLTQTFDKRARSWKYDIYFLIFEEISETFWFTLGI